MVEEGVDEIITIDKSYLDFDLKKLCTHANTHMNTQVHRHTHHACVISQGNLDTAWTFNDTMKYESLFFFRFLWLCLEKDPLTFRICLLVSFHQ